MTDREIIEKLIDKDERVTAEFFFKRCMPLFLSVIRLVFPYHVDLDEFVNDLYLYLMENDAAMDAYGQDRPYIPMAECAAVGEANLCDFQCEVWILNAYGVGFEDGKLAQEVRENRWLRDSGTPLHAIGKLLEENGLSVRRQYESTREALQAAIAAGEHVIAVVDGELLDGKSEYTDDDLCDYHAVVCLETGDTALKIYNPTKDAASEEYPFDLFMKAWREAGGYMVRVKNTPFEYEPRPLRLDDVMISAELLDLREAIAENAHEVWAAGRKKD